MARGKWPVLSGCNANIENGHYLERFPLFLLFLKQNFKNTFKTIFEYARVHMMNRLGIE